MNSKITFTTVTMLLSFLIAYCMDGTGVTRKDSPQTAHSTSKIETTIEPAIICTSKFFHEPEPNEDELKKMISPDEPYYFKNRNGTEFVATLDDGQLTVGKRSKNGAYPVFYTISVEDPYLLHQFCPLNDNYVLYVSSVDAGPGETGIMIRTDTGKETEVKIYNPEFSETTDMSLHQYSVAQIRANAFVLVAGGNRGILLINLENDRPVFKRIPIDDGEIDSGLKMKFKNGRLYFRKTDPATYEVGPEFPAPEQAQP